MSSDRRSEKIVIAGASSLLGSELKSLLKESRFAGWDYRLVDEEMAAGTLTEAGGEAAVIQRVEEDPSAVLVTHLSRDQRHSANYVWARPRTREQKSSIFRVPACPTRITPWFPRIEALSGKSISKKSKVFSVCSAPATAIAALSLSLRPLGLQRLVATAFQSVSEAGRHGVEELETQTSQLLSFQNIGSPVFGTQSAFNLLPAYGAESR